MFRRVLLAFTILGVLALSGTVATAQIARQISYQGLLTTPSGRPIDDGQYNLVLRLYDAPVGGTLVWEETQPTAVLKGLFNVYLGAVVPLTTVDFFGTQLYLETAIQGQAPFPRTRLSVAPYAVRAERADTASAIDDDATGFVRSLNGGQGNLVLAGRDGISILRTGDTIRISSTVTFNGLRNLSSPQNTIDVGSPNGPNTFIDVRDGAITATKIADGAVTNTKLGDASVTTPKLTDGSVTLQKLAPGLIPTTLPPSGPAGGDLTGTYPNPLIGSNTITSDKIADAAVGASDIADDAVSTPKIQDNAVTSSKLANSGVIPGSYGSASTMPQITVDAKGRVVAMSTIALGSFPPSGQAGGDLTGTYPNPLIANNAVTTPKILDGNVTTPKLADGAVTTPKIADNSVTSTKIQDGTIQAADLAPGLIPTTLPPSGPAGGELTGTYPNPLIANNAVTSAKIQDGAVTNVDLGANSVTTDKIQDGTVQSVDLASGVIPTTLPPSGTAGGVLSGTYPNPNLATSAGNAVLTAINDGATTMRLADNRLNTTGVIAGTYGNGTTGFVPRITVDQYGRITSAQQEFILSARPTGTAGGDLQGTYPDPLLNTTSAVGGRMVTALNNAFIGGNAAINTAQNLVMLDAASRFPARDGSLITNLNASNITNGILSVQRGGTGSGAALNSNRVMISVSGAIVESGALSAGQIVVGTGAGTPPAVGAIVGGTGINVAYSAPNITISSTDATVDAGTANDQTLRWNAATGRWTPNANVLATTSGSVTMSGDLVTNGASTLRGNADVGSNAGTMNRFGTGTGAVNTIGGDTPASTTSIRGTVNINTTIDAMTTIGNQASVNSSVTLAAGSNGNIVLENVDSDVPYAFLSINTSRQVRSTLATGTALEGVQWQSGSYRLGGQTGTDSPFMQNRFININSNRLAITRSGGTATMAQFDGLTNTIALTGGVAINTTTNSATRIGNVMSTTFVDGAAEVAGTMMVDGATTVTDTFTVRTNVPRHVATFRNDNVGNGDGVLIVLGKTHGAWTGSGYLTIANPPAFITSDMRNVVRGWLEGATVTMPSLVEFFPGVAFGASMARITNDVLAEINSGLGLPRTVVPSVNVFPGYVQELPNVPSITLPTWCIPETEICFGGETVSEGVSMPVIDIPSVNIGPYVLPAVSYKESGALPEVTFPDFRGSNVTNSLTRENHYVTFQDKDGRQTGAIKAESVSDWRDNTVLDDVYLTSLTASFMGIDLLDAAMRGHAQIINLVRSYNHMGVAYESGNGDYAEWLEREDPTERIGPGDVVGVRGGRISKSIDGAEQVMVVSHKPIVLGNMPDADQRPFGNDVAFMGQVPVKVMGAVNSGDYIVAKGAVRGYAVAVRPQDMTPEDFTRAVGRAWEASPVSGPKMVNTVIGVHNGEWARIVRGLDRRQTATEQRVRALEAIIREKLGAELESASAGPRP